MWRAGSLKHPKYQIFSMKIFPWGSKYSSEQAQLLFCEVSFQGTEASLQAASARPLDGSWLLLAHCSLFLVPKSQHTGMERAVVGVLQWDRPVVVRGGGQRSASQAVGGVWAHWVCFCAGERVLAFGRHRCCNHCTLWSVMIKYTLADLYSKKKLAGNSDPPPCPTFKTIKQDLQEQIFLVYTGSHWGLRG